jgi:uncharacterized protein
MCSAGLSVDEPFDVCRVGGEMHAVEPPPTLQQRLAERARPDGPVVLYQRWEQLLFLHWRWDVPAVQAALPAGLTVDVYDGSAWLGLVPLFMRDVRPRFVPAMPAISDFLELNLRTYVYDAAGRPGLYFHSLDCDQPLAVEMARRFLSLRYEHAAINAGVDADGWVDFESQRRGTVEKAVFRYHAFGPPATEAAPDSIEFFLLERYRLFAKSAGGDLRSIRVSHPPYRVRQAQVFRWGDAPLRLAGFDPRGAAPDHLCVTEPQEVETFAPEIVAAKKT